MGISPGNLDIMKGSGLTYSIMNNKLKILILTMVLIGGLILFTIPWWWGKVSEVDEKMANSTISDVHVLQSDQEG